MEYEHVSALVPGPGQYYPRKHYPHHKVAGVQEKNRKFGYYISGPGKPKKPVKLKSKPKDKLYYPEPVNFTTFNKSLVPKYSKVMEQKTKGFVEQHWGFQRRFDYHPNIPKKAGEKLNFAKIPGNVRGNRKKNFVPGPAMYNINSNWGLSKENKVQDIQKKVTKGVYRSIYYNG